MSYQFRQLARVGVLLALWLPLSALADGQFYFIGEVAPVGSMAGTGIDQRAVYLRWDLQEGDLPADLDRLTLTRDGQTLLDVAATANMSAAQLVQLYADAAQGRRLRETWRWMRELVSGENRTGDQGSQAQPPGDLESLAGQLLQRMQQDSFWAFLASRNDFNLARARYRGYLDMPENGVHDYVLSGISSEGDSVTLGRLQIDSSQATAGLAARQFRQIRLGRCDAPEAARDHGVVALYWEHGADSAAELLVQNLAVSGYDLYRSVANVAAVPARDLAAEARLLNFDNDGGLVFDGLEKVNDQPINVSGGVADPQPADPTQQPFIQFMETARELKARGVEPGDRRAYYLVPRDFTGNYGPTVGLLVSVPDLLAPPTPWGLEVEYDATSGAAYDPRAGHRPTGEAALVWDALDVRNYLRRHPQRTYCNAARRMDRPRLEYVREGRVCGDGSEQPVNLDVAGYRVYRFDTLQQATHFKDTDGDGYADADEAGSAAACDAAMVPAGATNHRVDLANPVGTERAVDGRARLRLTDVAPAQQRNRRFWYRLAAVGRNGEVSPLSEPREVHFPDRELPPRPRLGEDIKVLGGDIEHCESLKKVQLGEAGSNTALPEFGSDPTCTHVHVPDGLIPFEDHPGIYTGLEGCLTFSRRVGDRDYKLATLCGEELRGNVMDKLDLPGMGQGELTCLSVTAVNENNRQSPPLQLPCYPLLQAGAARPAMPQPVAIEFPDNVDTATARWRSPSQPLIGTLLIWTVDGGAQQSKYVAHAGEQGQTMDTAIDLGAAPAGNDWQQEVCFRALSIGERVAGGAPNAPFSDWSVPLCAIRTADDTLPQYLPWPAQAQPQAVDRQIQVAYDYPRQLPLLVIGEPIAASKAGSCEEVRRSFSRLTRFVIYRQSRKANGDVTSFVQVSPTIEGFGCRNTGTAIPRQGQIDDPFLEGVDFSATKPEPIDGNVGENLWDDPDNAYRIAFVDRYPHIGGREYRYQLIEMDNQGEISGYWKNSEWVRLP